MKEMLPIGNDWDNLGTTLGGTEKWTSCSTKSLHFGYIHTYGAVVDREHNRV